VTGKLYNEDCAYVNELPIAAEGLGVVILGTCRQTTEVFGVHFGGCLGMEPTTAQSRGLIALAAWGKIKLVAGLRNWVEDCGPYLFI
jgi:hypothetical protein